MSNLGFSQSEKKIYAVVSAGKFRLKKTEASDPSLVKSRTISKGPRAGEVVQEECHDKLTGFILTISFDRENQYGPQINVSVNAGEEIGFSLSLNSGMGKTFLKTLPNVDLSKAVTFAPRVEAITRTDGSAGTKESMLLQQDGTWLKQYFKMDAMNGMPEGKREVDKISKKEVYNDSDQQLFLMEYTTDNICPKLRKRNTSEAPAAEYSEHESDENDLPF